MKTGTTFRCCLIAVLCSAFPVWIAAEETVVAQTGESSTEASSDDILPGHSFHGEAFDTGPRQRAYLMGGTGEVHFPVGTDNPEVRSYLEQGLGQLHGFWFLEAERSFRQAAALEPDCAIAYWGMAMANEGNEKRAKEFSAKAMELKDKANRYEQLWIQSLHDAHHKTYKDDKERWQAFILALEGIVHEFPEDIEAKALLALHLFWNKSGKTLGVTSREAVDALLNQVFEKNPMHPAHHYRIHLWDNKKPERARESSARCGQSAPMIAHMWHMSGHIYSGLKRYEDACWQQEASSRVDHYHMVHDRVLPTEIHNYTHNQEWFIRNLIKVGRIRDALAMARNLVEIPRHPRHNAADKSNSAVARGRTRLLDVLIQFELWEELLELAETPYLAVEDDPQSQARKDRYLAVACYATGLLEAGESRLTSLEKLRDEKQARQKELKAVTKADGTTDGKVASDVDDSQSPRTSEPNVQTDKNSTAQPGTQTEPEEQKIASATEEKETAKLLRELKGELEKLEKAIAHVRGERARHSGDHAAALEFFKQAGDVPQIVLARAHLQAGEPREAEQLARKAVEADKNEVYPLAFQAKLLFDLEKKAESRKAFEQLRKLSAWIDTDLSLFAELEPLAQEFGYTQGWLREYQHRDDVGERPPLESLGPLTWHPSPAPAWELRDHTGKTVSLADYRGKPVVVIFYLGFGCLHCVEHLGTFSPLAEEFRKAGIEIVAIGTDDREALSDAITAYTKDKPIHFPLLSDAEQVVFDRYRCVDNFENQALHGTFLIDGVGNIRWQDIGPEPFTDARFLLREAQRLLNLPESTREKKSGIAAK